MGFWPNGFSFLSNILWAWLRENFKYTLKYSYLYGSVCYSVFQSFPLSQLINFIERDMHIWNCRPQMEILASCAASPPSIPPVVTLLHFSPHCFSNCIATATATSCGVRTISQSDNWRAICQSIMAMAIRLDGGGVINLVYNQSLSS